MDKSASSDFRGVTLREVGAIPKGVTVKCYGNGRDSDLLIEYKGVREWCKCNAVRRDG